jgi:hypothetical protein
LVDPESDVTIPIRTWLGFNTELMLSAIGSDHIEAALAKVVHTILANMTRKRERSYSEEENDLR